MASTNPEWELFEARLARSVQVAPAPGFARRWLVRLYRHRERRRQREANVLLGMLLLGAILTLVLLGLEGLRLAGSPAGLVSEWLRTGLGALDSLEGGYLALRGAWRGVPAIVGGVGAAVALGWASLLWCAALVRYAFVNLPNGGRE